MVNIDLHRLVTGNQHINSQIELMTVNQQWIGNIFADDTSFIDVDIVYVIYQIDTSPLARVCRLHNPDIFLALMLLKFLIVIVKVTEFVGKNVSVW